MMTYHIPVDELRSYFEQDDLESLYESVLRVYKENTNLNELDTYLKKEIQKTLLYAPDFETILERLVGLIDTYNQYFQT